MDLWSKVIACENCKRFFKTKTTSSTRCPFCNFRANFRNKITPRVFFRSMNEKETSKVVSELNSKPFLKDKLGL